MAPPKKPVPPDFGKVHAMCEGSPTAIAQHYSQAGVPVDYRTVKRWESEFGVASHSDPSNKTIREIIRESGDDPDKVEVTKVRGMRYDTPSGPNTYTSVEWKPSVAALAARIDGWKRPVIKPRKAGKGPELSVVCGDHHAPEHDKVLHEQFLTWLDENQPSKIVLLGDLLENSDVSRWEDRDGEASAEESIEAAYWILRDYIEASPQSELVWIEGNHDLRIGKHQKQGAPKLAKVHRANDPEPVMTVPYLVRLDELGVEYISDYPLGKYKLADNLVVIHGDKARQGAGATAIEHLKKRGYSIISGHTHRAAIVFKTTFDEDDTHSTLCGVETGTFKEIKPEVFDVTPDHQNFFVTVNKWGPRDWHIEPATFAGGHLRWRDRRY